MKKLLSVSQLAGQIEVPGDKSISHRAIMFGSLAKGTTTIHRFLLGEDCLSTISCFQKMGVDIEVNNKEVIVHGKGKEGMTEPVEILDVGNSGTTTRLMLGILAGMPFHACIIGDESIAKRPMGRVTKPLQKMGAKIDGRMDGKYTPISIRGGNITPIEYHSPVASAQVKSAILLAGLLSEKGKTTVIEPHTSRDHTERMLKSFGATVKIDGLTTSIEGGQQLKASHINVPGDISSAAFFLVAGAIVPNSSITLKNVGINPTRSGILDVLMEMGADITIDEHDTDQMEPLANIHIQSSQLKGIEIGGALIPRLIDEIPVIALLASQAQGTTVIKDAAELKVKETNRIDTVVQELSKLGVNIEATLDGMIIKGKNSLHGNATVSSYGDHRIGMMLAIASTICQEEILLENSEAINVSYPMFFEHLEQLAK
ncbi:3-phosphoshikimate 1-carboxyvinyltransferase [Bacillus carboniphilus]|uniref:3-phosphoshikimate 1-carboxyvinyltransferase n=1 Tax=Bacillus carboniphilus TaxID=86663 RepID=A0ABY9JWF6_9BACI|nr:3-phosphoshikimate 1-carboxyvinyltransferase [Bacillus carboniphilus]WLR43729.1 3-phosphoshikimate 1-carboxyvinyltransferase [Bacillus carboniphilus]